MYVNSMCNNTSCDDLLIDQVYAIMQVTKFTRGGILHPAYLYDLAGVDVSREHLEEPAGSETPGHTVLFI